MFNKNDVVRVIDKNAFYHKALGRIESIDPTQEYAYFVVFEMIDEETEEVSIYEDCYYYEYEKMGRRPQKCRSQKDHAHPFFSLRKPHGYNS